MKKQIKPFINRAQVGSLDDSNNKITCIYIKTDDYILYEVKTDKDDESLRFWQSDSSISNGKNESLYPVFYFFKSDLAKVQGFPNYKSLKYEAIRLMSEEDMKPNDKLIHEFHKKVDDEIKSQTKSKQTYILTGFVFSVLMIIFSCVVNIVVIPGIDTRSTPLNNIISYFNMETIYLFYAATMGTLGGYFSILRKINSFFLIGESARCGAVILAMSRLLIALTAGIVSYLIIRAGMYSISVAKTDFETLNTKSLYLINAFAFIAGFSETLIPAFMQNFEKNNSNQKTKV